MALAFALTGPATAQPTPGSQPESVLHVRAELVAEAATIQAGRPFRVGLHFLIDRGWHVNWRNPGDAGLAPSIAWELPPGFTAGPIEWPVPELIREPSLVSYGYTDEILLPVTITPPARLGPDSVVHLKASANWLECSDVCVPGKAELQLPLGIASGEPQPDPRFERLYEAISDRLPRPAALGSFTCRVTSGELILEGSEPVQVPLDSVLFFPIERGQIEAGAPQNWSVEDERLTVRLRRPASHGATPRALDGVLYTVPGLEGPGSSRALAITAKVASQGGWSATLRLVAVALVLLIGMGWLAMRRKHGT